MPKRQRQALLTSWPTLRRCLSLTRASIWWSAYNSLMDVEDMPAAVSEAARVLTRPGRFCICVTHPFADTGEFVGEGPDAHFTMTRPYFGHRRFEGTAQRDGQTMTFRGWTYSLEDYAIALESAGLVIELLREPRPEGSSVGDKASSRSPCSST